MIVAGSTNPLLMTSAGGYNLTRSLRFRSSASAYLSRTPASTTNQKTFTISMWVKRGNSGSNISLVSCRSGASPLFQYQFYSDNTLSVEGSSAQLRTTQVFRDFSAWYHIVLAIDTTQATSSDRMKMYVNGVQITSFGTATYPSQNTNFNYNVNSATSIGSLQPFDTQYFDGYMAEVHSIDGQALTPSSFGETNSKTGVWQPKKYAGTYGTNGFYLPFTDNSALTSGSNAGLGKDFSGNGNYWTTNNISITSGSTYDSMTDVPTLTSATASNFATLNPLNSPSGVTLSSGNLNYTSGGASNNTIAYSTISVSSGKWYAEYTHTTGTQLVGIASADASATLSYPGQDATSYGYASNNGQKYNNGATSYGATWTANDVIGIALDLDAGTLTFYKNNVSQGTAFTGISGTFKFAIGNNSGSTVTGVMNFGQRPFSYTPPTGYVALNTFNLPTPTIGATASSQANKYFDVNTYTGTGSTLAITNSGSMQPDFLWIKSRSNAANHALMDSIRGVSKQLQSSTTNAESTNSSGRGLQSFNSNGFTLGLESDAVGGTNDAGQSYVGWQWRASNAAGVTNTAGSITSTVSANTTSGFSVVTYSGQASDGTVGHGLGVAPRMIIVKNRTTGSTGWVTYHASLPSASSSIVYLNTTGAVITGVGTWNSTAPTSTVFSVDGGDSQVNAGSNNYVAYCFSAVAGYSAFGSYTGNGSTDGSFIYVGFKPRYVMIKRTDSADAWRIYDTARNTYNYVDKALYADQSAAEDTTSNIFDILSNGFKLRNSQGGTNASGGTYIYACFAENPFKYSLAR